jgi:hypothetical protein
MPSMSVSRVCKAIEVNSGFPGARMAAGPQWRNR